MFKEGDVYKCISHFAYCEEQGKCTSTKCPNYIKIGEVKAETVKDHLTVQADGAKSYSSKEVDH